MTFKDLGFAVMQGFQSITSIFLAMACSSVFIKEAHAGVRDVFRLPERAKLIAPCLRQTAAQPTIDATSVGRMHGAAFQCSFPPRIGAEHYN